MIIDLASGTVPAALEAMVCVVGGGPIGITLSLALARRGVAVVLLESGGREVDAATQDLNRAKNVGRNHNGINQARYRALGGASTQWGGQLLSLSPIDFEHRDWVAHSGWPIGFSELAPYYRRALEFAGLGGCEVDDRAVWGAIGMPAPAPIGGIGFHLSRWCPQPDFAKQHGAEIERLNEVKCILHATATSLRCTAERISSVTVRSLNGHRSEISAEWFVFTAGTVESARLLLQQLDDGSDPPWKSQATALGRFFMDHPTMECASILPRDKARFHQRMDMIYLGGVKYQPRIFLSAERQREVRSLNAGGVVLFETEISALVLHQVRVAARQLLRGTWSLSAIGTAARSATHAGPLILKQAWRYFVHKRAYNPADRGYRLLCFVEQEPNPDSRLLLSDETDTLGQRRVQLDWKITQREADAAFHFASAVKEAFESADIASVEIDGPIAARDPSALSRCWDNYHDMGAVRMGTSSSEGVVDRDLRIFGCENGFVCSHAVFPTGSFANPTHTTLALAVRLSDHLLGVMG